VSQPRADLLRSAFLTGESKNEARLTPMRRDKIMMNIELGEKNLSI